MSLKGHYLLFFALLFLLGGCSSNPLIASGEGGYYKEGGVYKVKGVRYRARKNLNYVETGMASWYGKQFHGRKTANGETYNMHQLTAAHKTLPMPTYVRVTNLDNQRSLVLRVNDRGPYKSDHGTDTRNRIIDVSRKAAQMLGFLKAGIGRVEVRYVGSARPSDEGKLYRQLKRRVVRGEWRAVEALKPKKLYYIKTQSFASKLKALTHKSKISSTQLGHTALERVGKHWRLIIGAFEAKNEVEAAQAVLFAHGYRETEILAIPHDP